MDNNQRLPKPWGFGLFTRIVFVHQALCAALFVAALFRNPFPGIDALVFPHLLGLALSVGVLIAMFTVASQRSLNALFWLRFILWSGVVKALLEQFWLLSHGQAQLAASVHSLLINQLLTIPVALYWSRPVHSSYLASLQRPGDHSAG